jgi:hypothetical protein
METVLILIAYGGLMVFLGALFGASLAAYVAVEDKDTEDDNIVYGPAKW